MIYCFLADGFEEVEAIAPIDILRRANIDVVTVGVTGEVITGRSGIKVTADKSISDIILSSSLQGIILPGGMPGALNLENNELVQNAIDFSFDNNKLICAICAAPQILGHKGILSGKQAIAYPGFEDELKGATISEKYVVRDGNIITAKGAGVAIDFALEIVSAVLNDDISEEIRKSIQCK